MNQVKIAQAIGCSIDKVEGCGGTLSGNLYTTGAVTADCEITATFISDTTYIVIQKAGRHGSILPDTPQEVHEGKTVSFTIVPDDGYSIESVSGCEGTLDGGTYTTGPIAAKCKVKASFKKNPVVTAKAGKNGSIEPSGQQTVSVGTVLSFTVTPDAGHVIKSVSGCEGTLDGSTYTTGPIAAKCRVKASFGRN